MITINLQYLAIIPGIIGAIALLICIGSFVKIFTGREIEKVIAFYSCFYALCLCASQTILVWLIIRAFRT